jgi:hypothetical protein
MVSRFCFIIGLLVCGLAAGIARAETYKLADGQELVGEILPTSANDQGVQVKVGEGEYRPVPWGKFSQDDLKRFAGNPRLEAFVEPFIEVTVEEKLRKTEVNIKEPPRLELPARRSLLGAMCSSGLGLLILLVLYGANVYAGYEVALFRAQPVPLVCGVAAVLPLAGPIIFLSMRARIEPSPQSAVAPPEGAPEGGPSAATAPASAGADEINPMRADGAVHPTALKLAHTEGDQEQKPALPPTITFQRGQFTFNRRFFETKFSGFFGVVRRDADKDMVLVIKSARGEYAGQRISRIAPNDLHLQVQRGPASEEVMIPFQEIQQIQLRHKDAH